MKQLYRPVVAMALQAGKSGGDVAAILVVAGLVLFTRLGSEFVPRLSEGTVVINFVRLAGISLEESIAYNTRIEKQLLTAFPDEIDRIWTRTGTAELSTDPMGLELSDMFHLAHIRVAAGERPTTRRSWLPLIDLELADLPGQNRIFTQPIEMRINEMIAGIRSDIGIKVFGDDLSVLETTAEADRRPRRNHPGKR